MEVEPQRLSRLIVEAERAIFVRYLELCMNPRPIEIGRDLQNAIYVLIDLKKSISVGTLRGHSRAQAQSCKSKGEQG
jgi:hypothetical protein